MATFIPFIVYFVVFSTFFSAISSKFSEQSPITMKDMEKKTSLHFYFHDIPGGKNQTSTAIARPINMTAAAKSFGITFMADDMLTEGPEPTSKLVGRAQGIYGFASQQNAVLLMVMNFAFVDGIYNGSSLILSFLNFTWFCFVERFHCCSNEILAVALGTWNDQVRIAHLRTSVPL
ncbi:dirigent protein [Salix suchowensis]|nr:dirigent protein [Salix suchowensis]